MKKNKDVLIRDKTQYELFSQVSAIDNHILPTNLTAWKHPIHRWYSFIAGYSTEFVSQCIKNSALDCNDVVLDPFTGCGTTLVTAAENGIPFNRRTNSNPQRKGLSLF